MIRLNNCPFCGSAAEVQVFTEYSSTNALYLVSCSVPKCATYTPGFKSKKAAIARWNKRPAEAAFSGLLAQAEALVASHECRLERMEGALKKIVGTAGKGRTSSKEVIKIAEDVLEEIP